MLAEQIKQEVFNPFRDNKYGKTTLIELFFKDKNAFYSKYKNKEVSEETADFFNRNMQKLLTVNDTMSIQFFREQEYMRLIDEYCDWREKTENSNQQKKQVEIQKEKNLKVSNKVEIDLSGVETAAEDEADLYKISKKVVEVNYKNHKYKQYALNKKKFFNCPLCEEKKKHAAVFVQGDKQIIYCIKCVKELLDNGGKIPSKAEKKKETKVGNKKETKVDKKKSKTLDTITILTSETNSGKLLWEVKKATNEGVEYAKYIAVTSSRMGKALSITKTVKNGKAKYVMTADKASMVFRSLDGLEEAIWKQNPKVIPVKIHIKTEEEKELEKLAREIEAIERQEEENRKKERHQQMLEQQKKQKEEARQAKLLAEKARQEKQRLQAEQKAKKVAEKMAIEEQARKEREAKERAELEKLPQIGVRDFVVRRNVFKCMHASHKLENVVAAVNIIDKYNEERLIRVNAGYCSNCKIFFIMESTYENLKNRGIPICRVSDEKTYLKNYSVNGMLLAQESILMQYGYNVNQQEGLSSTRRQKILAVLIDKKILGKSEIISYLDFFISQRQTQSKYQVAISKWEADREFVENYRIGEYHQYGVNAIYRR